MKKAVLVTLIVFFVGSISIVFAQDKKQAKSSSKFDQVVLNCKLHCGDCEAKIKKQLGFTKGVASVVTDLEKNQITVKYRKDRLDNAKIIASLGEIGYTASVNTPGCGTVKKGCCSSKAATASPATGCGAHKSQDGTAPKTGCCSSKAQPATGCGAKKATDAPATKQGCCSGKTTKAPCGGSK